MMQRSKLARGFTLIEVLVSLALMSLIATILIESLRVGGRSWQTVIRRASEANDIVRTQSFLRERLAAIYPPSSQPEQPDSLIGERDAIEFSSVAAGPSLPRLPVRYWLGLSQSGTTHLEVRYREELSGQDVAPSGWSREVLLERVTGMTIQYWAESALGGRWVDHWDDNRRLPRLLRVEVQFDHRDPRRWPPLYVEPRLDTPASCVFDVVSRRCREVL